MADMEGKRADGDRVNKPESMFDEAMEPKPKPKKPAGACPMCWARPYTAAEGCNNCGYVKGKVKK